MESKRNESLHCELKKHSFFSSLEPKDLDELLSLCSPLSVNASTTLFRDGDPADCMFFILSGEVQIHIDSQDGDVVLARLGPGEIIGEISMITRGTRSTHATVISDTKFFVIHHQHFNVFLSQHPKYNQILLRLLSSRLEKTNRLFLNFEGFNTVKSPEGEYCGNAPFLVTIAGYGNYGNLYIGPKYAKKGFPWEVQAIIDPVLNQSLLNNSVLGQTQANIPFYKDFDAWYEGYFKHLGKEEQRRVAIEIPLSPSLIYEQTMLFIEAGVKQIILPKPVVMTEEELISLSEAVKRNKVKAAVASHWYYADLPRIIRREIRRMSAERSSQFPNIHKVDIEFSKEQSSRKESPVYQCFPHAVQLLDSIGLLDLKKETPYVTGSSTLVEVRYEPQHIAGGIHLKAGLDFKPSKKIKQRYPCWEVQKRVAKIYFSHQEEVAGLEIDFWIKFSRSGDLAMRPGEITIREEDENGDIKPMKIHFLEDQLFKMNDTIYTSFDKPFHEFQNDSSVLSLERYYPIGSQLMHIYSEWQKIAD